mgnify:CR=1 FL=1
MANLTTYDGRFLDPEVKILAGSFAPAGTGAPTAKKGRRYTVARSDVGKFTITLLDKYVELLSVVASLQLATAAASVVQVGTYDATAGTIVLQVLTESTGALVAADIAANANNRVNFVLFFKDSTVP